MPLTVTVLVENRSLRDDLLAGRGLSLHLQADEHSVLFDTGPDERLITNAERLGIDLSRVSTIVLSHGHYDHSGGLPALAAWFARRSLRPQLVAHPAAFLSRGILLPLRRRAQPWRQLGSPMDQTALAKHFTLTLSDTPLPLPGRLCFLGQVPRRTGIPGGKSLGAKLTAQGWRRDEVADDSGLVWQGDDGLVVLSGCAHAGICNLTEQARQVGGVSQPVQAVLGGFHLRSSGPGDLWQVRGYFRQLGAARVGACHCSGWGRHWLPGQSDISTGSQLQFQ
ncbi:MBL fold metallo-hydrolase [Paludibacterium sp. B53371]|uniref:MBL fold metallo-hydrolase n=1 Tax=Paludibacterium sp. B53371 TaxID=2806263 RepID=UPI001C04A856|nr:MBL fold metallo-hydrolase [Paludibacterium sp. B53371]